MHIHNRTSKEKRFVVNDAFTAGVINVICGITSLALWVPLYHRATPLLRLLPHFPFIHLSSGQLTQTTPKYSHGLSVEVIYHCTLVVVDESS